jgi:hypothetical protein
MTALPPAVRRESRRIFSVSPRIFRISPEPADDSPGSTHLVKRPASLLPAPAGQKKCLASRPPKPANDERCPASHSPGPARQEKCLPSHEKRTAKQEECPASHSPGISTGQDGNRPDSTGKFHDLYKSPGLAISLSDAAAFNPGPESRVSAAETETPRREPELRHPKLQILQTKLEIHQRNAAISDSSLSFWRGIHTFPDRSEESADRSHAF